MTSKPSLSPKPRGARAILDDITLVTETLYGLSDVYPAITHTRKTMRRLLSELRRSLPSKRAGGR